jgi:hypothetical protein
MTAPARPPVITDDLFHLETVTAQAACGSGDWCQA